MQSTLVTNQSVDSVEYWLVPVGKDINAPYVTCLDIVLDCTQPVDHAIAFSIHKVFIKHDLSFDLDSDCLCIWSPNPINDTTLLGEYFQSNSFDICLDPIPGSGDVLAGCLVSIKFSNFEVRNVY